MPNFIKLFKPDRPAMWVRAINFFLIFAALSLFFCAVFSTQVYHWSVLSTYRAVFFKGWVSTILISLASLLLSLIIGLSACLMRRSKILVLRYLSQIYIELIRGTPLLVQLLFFFYVVASAFGIQSRYLVGIVTLSIFSGAYIAEIFRSGIDSVRKTMLESATAIGLTGFQTYRYVIFPISVRQILPPLAGQFASIIKDSSLLSILGISEFTYAAQQVSSATFSTLECYFPLAVGYLVLTFPISMISRYLEKRSRHEA
ncbi:MAG: amino acid ABC transporter permease [Verrucomicrobia bacterium]|nr:amino acid ABC transporter permease [Verrucomicrobiota bacterium]